MSARTLDPALKFRRFGYRTLTFSGRPSHVVLLRLDSIIAVLNPKGISAFGLASFAFARRYSQNLV